jgi:hypothetical protein
MAEFMNIWQTVQQEFACEHKRCHLVRYTRTNGTVCVREQCWRCGAKVRDVPKKDVSADIASLPEWNEALREFWNQAMQDRSEELRAEQQQAFEEERQAKNAEWWRRYNAYLHSQHWHDVRKKVLDRDGGICQACLKNKATQVHHLSYGLYEQLGRSAAFELVSICYTCHCAIHPQLADSQRNLSFYNPYLNGGNNGQR